MLEFIAMNTKNLFEQTKKLSLLIVEDYAPLREELLDIMSNYFDYCEVATDGQKGLDHYSAYHDKHGTYFDLILTDIKMPELSGVAMIETIYQYNESQSIIVLSAHNEAHYLMDLVNLGIEQFITKPLKHEQILSTLFEICTKINQNKEESLSGTKVHFDDKSYFDREKMVFYYEKEPIYMTKNELLFLMLTTEHLDKVYSNDEVVHYFDYAGVHISDENIRSLVTKLRKKLPCDCIETIYAMGYKLVLPRESKI